VKVRKRGAAAGASEGDGGRGLKDSGSGLLLLLREAAARLLKRGGVCQREMEPQSLCLTLACLPALKPAPTHLHHRLDVGLRSARR